MLLCPLDGKELLRLETILQKKKSEMNIIILAKRMLLWVEKHSVSLAIAAFVLTMLNILQRYRSAPSQSVYFVVHPSVRWTQ